MDARNEDQDFYTDGTQGVLRDELDWPIRCHSYAAYNCPEEEYSPRPSPVPPDYIDNLQSRLVKVKMDILPPTLKMILKTYYRLPPHQAPVYPQQQEIP